MDYKKILRALLSKAYKLDSETLDTMLNTEDEAVLEAALLDKDKDRVTTLSTPKPGQTFQDGYKKAKGEVLSQFETDVKTKFGVDADVTGIELVELLVEQKGKGTAGKGTLTDDDVKKHPVYQTLESNQKRALADKEAEWKTKYETFESSVNRDRTFGTVKSEAMKILEKLNPVHSKNATVAQTLKDTYAQALSAYEFDIQEGGRIVVMKDGKVVDDGHGNSLDFEVLAKNTAAKFYEFQNNNGGGNAGNQNNPGDTVPGAYPAGVNRPKTIDELSAIMDNEAIKVEDKQVVLAEWDKDNA